MASKVLRFSLVIFWYIILPSVPPRGYFFFQEIPLWLCVNLISRLGAILCSSPCFPSSPGFWLFSRAPFLVMVNGLHLYNAFIHHALQFMPPIHTFTHSHLHSQWQLAAMQGTNQLIRSIWGLGVLLRDTSTCVGFEVGFDLRWDLNRQPSDGNPPTARRQLLPPELYRPILVIVSTWGRFCSFWLHTNC